MKCEGCLIAAGYSIIIISIVIVTTNGIFRITYIDPGDVIRGMTRRQVVRTLKRVIYRINENY